MPARIVRGVGFAGVDRQLQQLLRLRQPLGRRGSSPLQLDLHEVVDGDERRSPLVPAAAGAPVPVPATGAAVDARRVRCGGRLGSSLTAIAPLSSMRGHSAPALMMCLLAATSPGGVVQTHARRPGAGSPMRRRISVADAGIIGRSSTRGDAHGLGGVRTARRSARRPSPDLSRAPTAESSATNSLVALTRRNAAAAASCSPGAPSRRCRPRRPSAATAASAAAAAPARQARPAGSARSSTPRG